MDIVIYLFTGIFAGLFAGLLGIGGGLIIVPVLFFVFMQQGFDTQHIMHIALATSLATIIITSLSSIYAHQKKRAINWHIFFKMVPGVLLGAFLVGAISSYIEAGFLKNTFILFEVIVAYRLFFSSENLIHRKLISITYPFIGFLIGGVSSIVGIGGGTLSVPFLHYTGLSFPKAIATSAAIGLPIAIAGSLGYILSGWQILEGLFLGFVYLPAWFSIIISSVLFAPIGAKLAHSLPIPMLKKIFAALLAIIAIKMLLLGD